MRDQLLKGHLPILVLGLISEGPIHGYGLACRMRHRGEGLLQIGEGTLYPLLHRLENDKLIVSSWEKGPTGKERKVYRISQAGRRKMAKGKKEWKELCAIVRDYLGQDWLTYEQTY